MIALTSGGALTLVLLVGALMLGLAGPDLTGLRFNLVWFECCMVACALLNQVLAFWLNGMATPEGRRWRPDGGPHHLQHVEIQSWTPVPLAIGVVPAAWTAWVSVAPWAGVAVVVGSAIVWTILKVLWSVLWSRRPGSRLAVLPPAVPPGGAAPSVVFRRALLGVALLLALALIVFLVTRVVLSVLDLPGTDLPR